VLDGGRYILGPEVQAFERELADYLGVRHVVGVGNGTDAITIALRALGVGAGDEVVVPSFTFYATAEAVASFGAKPVFCDVDPLPRLAGQGNVRAGRVQLAARRGPGGGAEGAAARARPVVRRPPRDRAGVCRGRARQLRDAAGGPRDRGARVAPVRRRAPARGPAASGAERGRDRGAEPLPHAAPPPARAAGLRRRRAPSGPGRARAH